MNTSLREYCSRDSGNWPNEACAHIGVRIKMLQSMILHIKSRWSLTNNTNHILWIRGTLQPSHRSPREHWRSEKFLKADCRHSRTWRLNDNVQGSIVVSDHTVPGWNASRRAQILVRPRPCHEWCRATMPSIITCVFSRPFWPCIAILVPQQHCELLVNQHSVHLLGLWCQHYQISPTHHYKRTTITNEKESISSSPTMKRLLKTATISLSAKTSSQTALKSPSKN